MEHTFQIGEHDIKKQAPTILTSSKNPTPIDAIFLSSIDQTVAFPVETLYFYEAPPRSKSSEHDDIVERMRNAATELLIPYYFMAGRLNFNVQTKRLELVCNNAGAHFMGATSHLELKDLGNVCAPNRSFEHLVLRTDGFKNLNETPLLTIQVTKFKCGGFSVGFVTNHSILDGKSACDIFNNLASVYKGEGLMTCTLNNDRSCFRARHPPQISFPHSEYIKLADVDSNANSSFTSPDQPSRSISLGEVQENQSYRVFPFSAQMIQSLKDRALTKCSTFEATVAHIWKARTRAVFEDPNETSSVLFAVDIRSKVSPPVPDGFIGNAIITACASAKVADLEEKPLSFCVKMVKEAIARVTDEYVKSVIDWLEVYKGIPATSNGNFYVSAWWKLPLSELDFGYGRPLYGGPIVSGKDEFVLLLSDGKRKEEGGGINVWIGLEKQKMDKFMMHVYDI